MISKNKLHEKVPFSIILLKSIYPNYSYRDRSTFIKLGDK